MRRLRFASIAAVSILLLSARGLALHAHAGDASRGRVVAMRMPAPSLGQRTRPVRVYLPPSYSDPASAARRFPVVFVLHGWPGSEANWPGLGHAATTADTLIAAGRIPETILVFPRMSSGFLGRTMGLDSWDGKVRMQQFLARDLPAWADSAFRTLPGPQAHAVIGLSDGATAAFDLAFKHPDRFGGCGGHSGEFLPRRSFGLGHMLGPEPGGSRLLADNSPTLLAASAAPALGATRIYFDCGLSDQPLEDNRRLHRTLDSLGVAHTYREFPGSHTWTYWRSHFAASLTAMLGADTVAVR